MIEVKVEGNNIEFTAAGSTKQLLEDAVKVVLGTCDSIAHRRGNPEGFREFLLHNVIRQLVDIEIGEAKTTSVIVDHEAIKREVKGDRDD